MDDAPIRVAGAKMGGKFDRGGYIEKNELCHLQQRFYTHSPLLNNHINNAKGERRISITTFAGRNSSPNSHRNCHTQGSKFKEREPDGTL